MLYDLIDNELKSYYISGHKYMFLISALLSFIFCVFLFFNTSTFIIILLVIFAIIAFIFLITWIKNKKMYEKKLGIIDDEIIIYDYKKNKIQEFKVSEVKAAFIDIAFDEYPRFKHRKCMIIYVDFEPYNGMEYKSYYNMTNVQIIQNNELIEVLNNILINK